MNKRNKPASLTGSLLARKGEAEPAMQPYSFTDADGGGVTPPVTDSGTGALGGAELTASGNSPEPPPAMSPSGPGIPDAPGDGWPQPAAAEENSVGGGGGNGGDATPDREQMRDRRLLRFVYATAALTGILAVVIYAGDWFFDSPTRTGQTVENMTPIVSDPPPEGDRKPTADQPAVQPAAPQEAMSPPVPPAPLAPAREEAAATGGETSAPSQTTAGTESTQMGAAPEGSQTEAGGAAPAPAQPAAESPTMSVAPTATSPEPAKPDDTPPPAAAPVESAKAPPLVPEAPAPVASAPSPPASAAKEEKSVAAVAPETPSAPKATASGRYLAQLGSVTSEAGAKQFWERVRKKYPDILGDYDLIVEKRDVANRGTFYRVQVGRFATFQEVRGLCDMLKARKQGCLPVKR